MPSVANVVPSETDILCERCGYTLNGLSAAGNCPECGASIAESGDADGRSLSRFELSPNRRGYFQTVCALMLHPGKFYRTLSTRIATPQATRFARLNQWIAAVLFSAAAVGHATWINRTIGRPLTFASLPFWLIVGACGAVITYALLRGVERLAAWLSAIEAKYWGMRLPLSTVRRGLDFHTVHYLIVGIAANAVIWGYQLALARNWTSYLTAPAYLYTLCAVVIISAGYLFQMYWIGMRNMRYANR